MNVDVIFRVAVEERVDWPLDGNDTVIAKMDARPVLERDALIKWAMKVGEIQGRKLGTRFHNGDFVVTSNPDTVREWGIMPDHRDCPDCNVGLAEALATLELDPTTVLIIGQLYWSPAPREGAG